MLKQDCVEAGALADVVFAVVFLVVHVAVVRCWILSAVAIDCSFSPVVVCPFSPVVVCSFLLVLLLPFILLLMLFFVLLVL